MEHFTLFFFNDAATTEIYTLSLHDALPIWLVMPRLGELEARLHLTAVGVAIRLIAGDEATAALLAEGRERLDEALAAAAVPLTGFVSETRARDDATEAAPAGER